ncbi:hypothetical protein [Rhizobium halophytocola]|uniref:DUF2188 domain-containing protein n=1 Tax=Rhizobium halophytocola TaxID=735519 RepID=A0ABS4DTY2_9HYPH|nr:hypothetical protein [Rhizobium halophytocola]MBP1849127.1 hypothetical protein [Rhizobium halophytocola]
MKIITDSSRVPAESIIIKLYPDGDTVRGYVRTKGEGDREDAIFPGEQLEPRKAVEIAESHNRGRTTPVYVEMEKGIVWQSAWGVAEPAGPH